MSHKNFRSRLIKTFLHAVAVVFFGGGTFSVAMSVGQNEAAIAIIVGTVLYLFASGYDLLTDLNS